MITAERLREALNYDPETGVFTWRIDTGRYPPGMVAGTLRSDGYRYIKVDGRGYLAHRLAWLHTTGTWPAQQIDHRDGDRANNRLGNLREATNAQNAANSRLNAGKLLPKGVFYRASSGRYLANIRHGGKLRHLGTFTTAEQAHRAYQHAANMLHGEFARTG